MRAAAEQTGMTIESGGLMTLSERRAAAPAHPMQNPKGRSTAHGFSSPDRIVTTHVGRIPRRLSLLDRLLARLDEAFDPSDHAAGISAAVQSCVRQQSEAGIGIVADGEERTGFALYLQDRLSGLEPRPGRALPGFKKRHGLFLEDFERCLGDAIRSGTMISHIPMICTGPIEYMGQADLESDLENLRSATRHVDCDAAFMTSIAPGALGSNQYYPSETAYHEAAGEALRAEYKAIVDAGFILQIDDPWLPALFADTQLDGKEADRRALAYVEMLNHSLRGIDADKIRYFMRCTTSKSVTASSYRFHALAGHMIGLNVGTYAFEANMVRHEEDLDLWQTLRFPAGKRIMPSLVNCMNPEIEDPDLLGRRIVGFANRVGRSGVIPSADTRGHDLAIAGPDSAGGLWAKLDALALGAEQASRKLWNSYPRSHGLGIAAVAA